MRPKTFLQLYEAAVAASPEAGARDYDPMGQACQFMKGQCDQNANILDLMPGVPRFIEAEDLGRLAHVEGFYGMEVTPGGRIRLHFRQQGG